MSESWRYIENGAPQGPVTEEALRQLIGTEQLDVDVLVWRPGLVDWTQASQVPELAPPRIQLAEPPAPVAEDPNPFQPPKAAILAVPEPTDLESGAAVAGALEALRGTKPWARFMAVMGMIGIGFMVLISLTVSLFTRGRLRGMPGPMQVVLPVIYLVFGGLQLPLVIFLNRYASRIGTLLESHAPEDLQRALEAQKSFWKYLGIITLVVLCVYGLSLLFIVGSVAVAAGMRRF